MILDKLTRTSVAALGALAVASVTQANAADIYSGGGGYKDVPVPVACCSFTGFYIGANAGMAFSEIDHNGGAFTDAWVDQENRVWSNRGNFNNDNLHSTNGFIGGQLGYNWQNACCWVYGLEVDLGAIGLNNRTHRYLQMNDPAVAGVALDGNNGDDAVFAGDVTGRLGYAFGSSMVYVKGGFAFINANNNLRETIYWNGIGPNGNASDSYNGNNNNNFLTGWTVGAGFEWKPCCQGNWSIKIEYLHYDFSNNNNNCCNDWYNQQNIGIYNNYRDKNDLTSDTIKIGFNYFLSPSVAVAPLK
jgi:hypothetical protein